MKHLFLRQLNPKYWLWALLPFFVITAIGLSLVLFRGCNDIEVSQISCGDADYSVDSVIACNALTQAGAFGLDQKFRVGLGEQKGTVWVRYDMYTVPDDIKVIYNGKEIHHSGMISGEHQFSFTYKGSRKGPSYCDVIMQAPSYQTGWEFTVYCPGNSDGLPSD